MHAALQYEGSGVGSVWVNGEKTQHLTGATAGWDPACRLYVGGHHASGSYFTGGAVSAMRLSNTVRYTGDFTPESRLGDDEDTVWVFDFAEGAGSTTGDDSGVHVLDVPEAWSWESSGPGCE